MRVKEKIQSVMKSGLALAIAICLFFVTGYGLYRATSPYVRSLVRKMTAPVATDNNTLLLADVGEGSSSSSSSESSSVPQVTSKIPSAETRSKIKETPPNYSTPKSAETSETEKNSDGSTTTKVASGDLDECSRTLTNATINSISDIPYIDETGKYPALGTTIKEYLNSYLYHSNEFKKLKTIVVKEAGNTGWSGLYCGGYTMTSGGDITSAYGFIIINISAYKSSPIFEDIVKVVFAHEYGHHFTLYYKWVSLDSPIGERFPDQYYTIRPLGKSGTATDYSLGWQNCDVEVLAEDYSYFYSGYSYMNPSMVSVWGYPSNSAKIWIANLPSASVSDSLPSVAITSPTNGATLSDNFDFTVDATDDKGVNSVDFYIDNVKISTDSSSPYSISVNSQNYSNASHTLRAVAFDSSQSAEASITVTISNIAPADSTPPTVTITNPTENPYTWASGNLQLSVVSSDNVGINKVEVYVDDQLALTTAQSNFSAVWQFSSVGPGVYALKVKAYDAAGNVSETTKQIIKL